MRGIIAPIARDVDSLSQDRLPRWKPHTSPTKLSRLGKYSPSRYSSSYWANSSDTSAFYSYRFSFVGRRSLWRKFRRRHSAPGLACHYLSLSSFRQDLQLESPLRMISAILLLSYQLILFKIYLGIIYFLGKLMKFESLKEANLVGKMLLNRSP